jgi:hypothetical protein
MNLNATFITHKQFPFTQVFPITYSCDLSSQHEKRIERRLLTERHKNTKTDLSMTDFFFWLNSPPVGQGLLIIQDSRSYSRHITLGRTPLDEWLTRRRDLYLTTHNTHNRQTSMPPVGFEPAIPSSKRLQSYALDRAATGTGPIAYTVLRMVLNASRNSHLFKLSGPFG